MENIDEEKDITEFKHKYDNVINIPSRFCHKINEISKHFNIGSSNNKELDFSHSMLYCYFEGSVHQNIDHLFTDTFLLYTVICAIGIGEKQNTDFYDGLDAFLYVILNASKDSLIYYYSSYLDYVADTYSSFYLHPPYIKKESNRTCKEIYTELFSEEEEIFMDRYIKCFDEEIVKKTKYKQEFTTARKILSIIGSYCVVNKELDKFNERVDYFMNNCYEIIKKFELDGVAQMIDDDEITIDSDELVQYIINVVLEDNNKRIE